MSDARDYEKLGSFYLGRLVGGDGAVSEQVVLYDAKDLTTHAVVLGMTGSGKTGLCVSLLEEAAIDGIPAIAIDPKGDLGNLLLSFPSLSPAEFLPWIDEAEAAREGHTPAEHARHVADRWRKGLASWGQDAERIGRFRESVDMALYTPGSRAGRPLSVLRSLSAPTAALRDDPDALLERTQSTVSGLLALLGIDADPIRSREHILMSNVVQRAWVEGRDLSLASLIREIQSPPFEKVGVFDLETFFPAGERMELAMTLNNLLASPGFAAWSDGEPLDVGRLLYTAEGKPRLSILSIAHLSDPERMFFVTLLLNEVIAWMRSQPGTSSLRAILYMDEVFGYLPPTANPPSKTPMLTLLKQARAYGLGCVLATQNPVDLDYKALSNTGTWLLGRLQTERDKARVIEGLEGASATTGAAFDRQHMERLLAGLHSRMFLLNNVHEDESVLMHTRWALSYLRGPLTRAQISKLQPSVAPTPGPVSATAPGVVAPTPAPAAAVQKPVERPVLPAEAAERFLAVSTPAPAGATLTYRPALQAQVSLHYASAKAKVDDWQAASYVTPLESGAGSPWHEASEVDPRALEGVPAPESGASFAELPAAAQRGKSYARWSKMLASHVYRDRALEIFKCSELKAISKPGETAGEFRVQLNQLLHERRDLQVEKLRKKWAPKLAGLQERIRKAEVRVEKEAEQYKGQKLQAAISLGSTVLGAIFGRKLGSAGNVGRATTAMRGAGRAARERGDIERAREEVEAQREQLAEMESEFVEQTAALRDGGDASTLEISVVPVRPRKGDIAVEGLCLLWVPWWVSADGIARAAAPLTPIGRSSE